MNNSPTSLQINSELKSELSIYKGKLTDRCLTNSIVTIKKTFPSLPLGFYDILVDRIRANNFNDERLKDAVANVIDTCIYPTPTVANFISYDRKIKTYTYNQYVRLVDEGDNGANYKPIKFKDRPVLVWIHVNDIVKYNIKSEA